MIRILGSLLLIALSVVPSRADFQALLDYTRLGNGWGVAIELARGTSPDRPDWEDGYTPLMFAAGNGDVAMTRRLIAAGGDVDTRDHNGDRALLWAAQRGYVETVALLLAAGAAAQSADDPYGDTPLMQAARYGHVAVGKLLLDAGADPNAVDQSLDTALHGAALAQSPAFVTLLLARGADPDAADEILLETPLHIAAARDSVEVVRLLIAAGAGLEGVDSDGRTPLYLAAVTANAANVAALLDAGANPNPPGPNPLVAALGAAAGHGDPRATAMLLAPLVADVQVSFATALWAGYDDVAAVLLERGASMEAIDALGRPPLAAAVMYPGLGMLDLLLAHGASLETTGPAALLAAAGAGRLDLAMRLLVLGVPADVRSPRGATPLLEAAASGRVLMVRLLLASGADPGARDNFGAGAAAYMEIQPSFIEARIDMRAASRAYLPTEELEITLGDVRQRHAEIRQILGLPAD